MNTLIKKALVYSKSINSSIAIVTMTFLTMIHYNQSDARCVYEKTITSEDLQIGIMLSWATAKEDNNALFFVEKSENNNDFTTIGTIQAAGSTKDTRHYNFLDIMANGKRIFYRLKQTDTDGTYSYTESIIASKEIPNYFMVARMSPTNSSKEFNVTLDVLKEGVLDYKLVDLQGSIVKKGTINAINGLNEIKISLADVKPNIYKFVMIMGKEEESLVIQKILDEIEKKPNVAVNKKVGTKDKG